MRGGLRPWVGDFESSVEPEPVAAPRMFGTDGASQALSLSACPSNAQAMIRGTWVRMWVATHAESD